MRITGEKNSKFVIPLMIASVMIWGIIIYKIFTAFSSVDDEVLVAGDESENVKFEKLDEDDINRVDTMEYEELSRDPFLFGNSIRRSMPKGEPKSKKEDKKKPQIKYQINGIVINEKSKLVVFEDLTNKKTLFLREGETYSDITIKSISDNKIILKDREEGKEFIVNQ